MAGGDDIGLHPAVRRETSARKIRHLINIAREPQFPRLGCPHRQAVFAQRGRRNATAGHVVTQVSGREDEEMLRILNHSMIDQMKGGEHRREGLGLPMIRDID